MPLSDHEQKKLEEMERALLAEDPTFAHHMRGSTLRSAGRSLRSRQVIGGVGVLVGIGVVVLGITTQQIWVGAIGFAVMVASAAWALTGSGSAPQPAATGPKGARTPQGKAARPSGKVKRQQQKSSFMQRMEERWEKRRREGGR